MATVDTNPSIPDFAEAIDMARSAGPPVVTTRYYKRAWWVESAIYAYWDAAAVTDPCPGGGTMLPPLGVVLYTHGG